MDLDTEWSIVAFKSDGCGKLRPGARMVSPHRRVDCARQNTKSRRNTKPYFAIHRFWSRSLRDRKNLYRLAVVIKSDGPHRFRLPPFPVIRDSGANPANPEFLILSKQQRARGFCAGTVHPVVTHCVLVVNEG